MRGCSLEKASLTGDPGEARRKGFWKLHLVEHLRQQCEVKASIMTMPLDWQNSRKWKWENIPVPERTVCAPQAPSTAKSDADMGMNTDSHTEWRQKRWLKEAHQLVLWEVQGGDTVWLWCRDHPSLHFTDWKNEVNGASLSLPSQLKAQENHHRTHSPNPFGILTLYKINHTITTQWDDGKRRVLENARFRNLETTSNNSFYR